MVKPVESASALTYQLNALRKGTVFPVFLREPLENAALTLSLHCRRTQQTEGGRGQSGLFLSVCFNNLIRTKNTKLFQVIFKPLKPFRSC